MTSFKLIAAAAALALAGTVPAEARVTVDQTSSRALVRGSTFAWAPVPATGYGVVDPEVTNQITADRLSTLTVSTLVSKGYRQVVDPAQADLLVTYTIIMRPDGRARPGSDGAQSGHGSATPSSPEGTLVLDLIERETGRLVLRATSKKRVTGKDVSAKKLTALLGEMTKSLPQE